MARTIELVPPGGWDDFPEREALSERIWDGLSEAEGQWKYINAVSGLSIWESQADGSHIVMAYRDGHGSLVELIVSEGVAASHVAPIAQAFGLVRAKEQP